MFRLTTWILVLLFSSAVLCQGKDGASFTECRVHIEAALNQYAANVEETPSTEVDESKISTEQADVISEETAPSEEPTVSIEEAAETSTEEALAEATSQESSVSEGSSEDVPPTEAEASEEAPAEEASGEAVPEEAAAEEAPAEEAAEAPAEEAAEAPAEDASVEGAAAEEASEEAPAVEESSGEEAAAETSAEAPTEDSSAEAGAEVSEAPVTEEASDQSSHEEASAEATEEPATESSGETSEEAAAEAPTEETAQEVSSEEVPAQESSAEESSAEGTASAEEASAEATEPTAAEESGSAESSEEVATAEQAPETEAAAEGSEEESGEDDSSEESSEVDVGSPSSGEVDASSGEVESDKNVEEEGAEEDEEAASSEDAMEGEAEEPELDAAEEVEPPPAHLRPRDHVDRLLGVDESSTEMNEVVQRVARTTLKDLKKVYDSSVKPLEAVYKYKDISTRHLGDPELYSKSMILIMGPWGSGKSTFVNYLLGNEYTPKALKTGSQPGSGFFNIIEFGESDALLDGTELVAQWEFSSLQKFGQAFLQRLQGHRMPNRLLEKVTLVDMPGIVERGKQLERDYPFNDVCQWFIDRSDLILVIFDPTRLDAGLEMEALFDQLKGREPQVRIVLNKADMVRPQDLMRVQGNLFWALSPLLGSSEPPVIYAGSFWSRLYRPGAPIRLFRAQEEALLLDIRDAFESRVDNRIALTRRHAVRVRNHAKMVDCYLNTFYSQKSFFGNKKKVAGEIVENPGEYRIYEGISTLTNVSRYDLPDPDIYKDFFRLHPLYDFPTLHSTCTFFRGCPLDKLDIAISYDLPELLGKHRKSLEQAIVKVHAGRGQ